MTTFDKNGKLVKPKEKKKARKKEDKKKDKK